MAKEHPKSWLDKIARLALDFCQDDDTKHSAEAEVNQSGQSITTPAASTPMATNAQGVVIDNPRSEAAELSLADKSSAPSGPLADAPWPSAERESMNSIFDSWEVFEEGWKNAGLCNRCFLGIDELATSLTLLDESFREELIGQLLQLSTKPEALKGVAAIIGRGNKARPTDNIDAIRAFPYVSIAIRPNPKEKEWVPEPQEVSIEIQRERDHKDIAAQSQLDLNQNETLEVLSLDPAETHSLKPDQSLASLSIDDLGVSNRSINLLKRQDIHTLSDLAGHDIESLSRLRNLGSTTAEEIRDSLWRYGLSLPFTLDASAHTGEKRGTGLGKDADSRNDVSSDLKDLGLTARTLNCLYRGKVFLVSDLEGVTEDDLLRIPNFGQTSLAELRQRLAERDISISVVSSRNVNIDLARDPDSPFTELETLREWARWNGSSCVVTLADVLALDNAALPEDVGAARDKLLSRALSSGHSEGLGACGMLDDLRALLNPSDLEILDRRRWSKSACTLTDIGSDIGLSRDRVRHLQRKAERALQQYVSNNRHLRWLLHRLRYKIGSLTAEEKLTDVIASHGVDADSLYGRMLLDLAGPYTVYEHGFAGLTGSDSQDKLIAQVKRTIEVNGCLDHETISTLLGSFGIMGETAVTRFLEKVVGLRLFTQQWLSWSGTVLDKSIVVLRVHGCPMTAEDINSKIGEGHSSRTLNNGMSNDDRFVRTSKKRWGLREWGLEEYSGIVDEIYERIDAKGGTAELEWIVDDIVRTFDVSENSVRLYIGTLAFIVENGQVRRRNNTDGLSVDSSLRSARGTYRIGESVRYEIRVSKDVLRGSGQAIPVGTAMALGVSPGSKRSFSSTTGVEVLVGWRPWSTSGPDIGSVRLLANEVGASEGEYLVLVFNTSDQTVETILVNAESDPETVLKHLADVRANSDAATLIADAIEVGRAEVRSALRARDDERVADMLLQNHGKDEGLRAAIGDLLEELR